MTLTENAPTQEPSDLATAPFDTETNALGVEVRRLRAAVGTKLSRYRLPTIDRSDSVDEDFKDFSPDGPAAITDSEDLTRGAKTWGAGIWPLHARRGKRKDLGNGEQGAGMHRRRTSVLTLRVGRVESDDPQRPEAAQYLRKGEYSVSALPIFRPDLDESALKSGQRKKAAAGGEPGDDERAALLDLLAPGQPPTRDFDVIRLALYGEAMSAWRQLTDVRFRLMSLLPAISIVAFVPLLLVTQSGNPFLALAGLVLALLGLGLTHGLHIYEERNDGLYNDLISRARRIEAELGVDTGVMLGRPAAPTPMINHGRATEWVYRCVKLAWLTVAVVLAAAAAAFASHWIRGDDKVDTVRVQLALSTSDASED